MTNAALRKHIGKSLQAARNKAGFKSARAFAESLGIEVTTYTSYEQGARAFSAEQAWNFAEALGCDIDELVGFETSNHQSFDDPNQEALNGYYESMNSEGRATLVASARLMADSNAVRIEKNQPEHLPLPTPLEGIA